jgi:hypothetical protein
MFNIETCNFNLRRAIDFCLKSPENIIAFNSFLLIGHEKETCLPYVYNLLVEKSVADDGNTAVCIHCKTGINNIISFKDLPEEAKNCNIFYIPEKYDMDAPIVNI